MSARVARRLAPRLLGLAIAISERSISSTRRIETRETEAQMSERGSSGLFEVVFYCVGLVALLLWSFRHVSFPW
jgi:hypothetical protein